MFHFHYSLICLGLGFCNDDKFIIYISNIPPVFSFFIWNCWNITEHITALGTKALEEPTLVLGNNENRSERKDLLKNIKLRQKF